MRETVTPEMFSKICGENPEGTKAFFFLCFDIIVRHRRKQALKDRQSQEQQ